jgi:hypothetical protein
MGFLHAAEVDSFTGYPYPLEDATALLDAEAQQRLALAVNEANRLAVFNRKHPRTGQPLFPSIKGISYCNRGLLINALENQLAASLIGQLETFAQEDPRIDRHSVPYAASIYRDFTRDETLTLARSGRLAAIISINGTFIGTDKLGHFLTEGLAYYLRLHKPGAQLTDLLELGALMESTYFGAVTTGVYSFADLAANVQGARFWSQLLDQTTLADLQTLTGPQVICSHQQWVLEGQFTWRDFVDPAWDEAANCSMIRNERLINKLRHALGDHTCPRYALPIGLDQRYGVFAPYVLNRQGFMVLPVNLEPDVVVQSYLLEEAPDSWWRLWVAGKLTELYHDWEAAQRFPLTSD